MSEPWLSIIGLGEDGLAGLSDASRSALAAAEIVFGAPRHLALAGIKAGQADRGRLWPVPFDLAPLLALRGRPVALLASGDPFWFGSNVADREAVQVTDLLLQLRPDRQKRAPFRGGRHWWRAGAAAGQPDHH